MIVPQGHKDLGCRLHHAPRGSHVDIKTAPQRTVETCPALARAPDHSTPDEKLSGER